MTLAALAVIGAAAPARAEDGVERAREHYNAGLTARRTGDYERAAAELKRSYRLSRDPKVLYALGLTHEEWGKRDLAAGYYWRYLNSGQLAPAEQEAVRRKIRELASTDPAPPEPVAPRPPAPEPRAPEPRAPEPRIPEPEPPTPEPTEPGPEPEPEPEPEPDVAQVVPPVGPEELDDEPPLVPPRRPSFADTGVEPETVWYGSQLLLAELGGWTLVGLGFGTDSGGLAAVGVIGVIVGGPIVHAVNGRGGAAVGSLGLKLGATLVGGAAADLGGAVMGYLLAEIVDIAYLGRKPNPKRAIRPTAAVTAGGAQLGLAFEF